MDYKTLFCFIAQCLSPEEQPGFREMVLSAFKSGRINQDEFIYTCSNNLVLPAVWLIFEKYGLTGIFPREYREHLNQLTQKNRERNAQILQQVTEINQALAEQNISPVYLKGVAHLLDGLYTNPAERMIGDIDVLITTSNFLKSAEIIEKLGYQPAAPVYANVVTAKHYPRLFRKDVPADVEIHRIPVNSRFTGLLNTEMIFKNRKKIETTTNCYVPSNEHQALHNFIHSQLINLGHKLKTNSSRDLYDLYLLSKRINIQDVIQKAEEKEKMAIWFSFLSHYFNQEEQSTPVNPQKKKRFFSMYDRFLNNPSRHRRYILVQKIVDVVVIRSYLQLKNFFTQKATRKGVLERITDPFFYRFIIYRIRNFHKNYIRLK